jgi:pullulanase
MNARSMMTESSARRSPRAAAIIPMTTAIVLACFAMTPLGPASAVLGPSPALAGLVDVTFRVTVPPTTPEHDPVYIAGDFQGWNPGHADFQLIEGDPRVYEIVLTFEVGANLQFKFTRGSWQKVEKGPNGEEIPNRQYLVEGSATVELVVANWADSGESTITGDVTLLTVPGFLNERRVWVYLPPGYDDEPGERYPVLYMLDGQNVFDAATSYSGEWEVDETCEELIPAGEIRPIIVVAVANGEADRGFEYTPWYDAVRGFGGGGAAHIQEFVDVLIPWVNANYRTLTGREHTGLSGSSLGGLLPMHTAYAQPETFGLIGALSPSIQWANHELLNWAASNPKPESRVYMDMGTRESGSLVDVNPQNGIDDSIDNLRALRDVLLAQGFALDGDLMVVEDEGANHHERFWAARFPEVLKFLFSPKQVATEGKSFGEFKADHGGGS